MNIKFEGSASQLMNFIESYANLDHCWGELEESLNECYGVQEETIENSD